MKIRIQISVGRLILPNIQCEPSQAVEAIYKKTASCVKWSSWGQRKMVYYKSCYLHSSVSRNGGAGWVSAIAYLCSAGALPTLLKPDSAPTVSCGERQNLKASDVANELALIFFQVNKAECLRALPRRFIVRCFRKQWSSCVLNLLSMYCSNDQEQPARPATKGCKSELSSGGRAKLSLCSEFPSLQ